MKISLYTFFFFIENIPYIYNSVSNALIEIDEESYNVLNIAKQNKCNISENEIDGNLYDILHDKHFLTENDWDEFIEYKKNALDRRMSADRLIITIAPTMDCNYSCPYCFENRTNAYISDKTINSIVNYVKNQKHVYAVRILWFGGEPLMAINEMKILYEQLNLIEGKSFTSGIITNGYYLNHETIKILQSLNVDSIQITFDGLKDTHNNIKYTNDCNDTFSVTIENIDSVISLAPEININIRINTDKNNAHEYALLYNYLRDRYCNVSKLSIAPGIIQDFEDNTLAPNSCELFSRQEVMEFGLNVYKEDNIVTSLVKYPSSFFRECSVRNKNTVAFDPEGYVYKCWEVLGKKQFSVGRLNDEGQIVDVNHKLMNRYHYGADPLEDKKCQQCSYLPICEGGCPQHRIENKFNGKNMDTCVHYKGFLPELMRVHLKTKAK